jgi:hypothetical protein
LEVRIGLGKISPLTKSPPISEENEVKITDKKKNSGEMPQIGRKKHDREKGADLGLHSSPHVVSFSFSSIAFYPFH